MRVTRPKPTPMPQVWWVLFRCDEEGFSLLAMSKWVSKMGVRHDEEGFPSWWHQNGARRDGKGRTPPGNVLDMMGRGWPHRNRCLMQQGGVKNPSCHVVVSAKVCKVSYYYNSIILKNAPIVGDGRNGPSPALVVSRCPCCVVLCCSVVAMLWQSSSMVSNGGGS